MHGNFLDVPNFSHSHISQSQWRNHEIIFDTGFLGYLNYTMQLFCKLFPTQLTSIHIWNPTNLIWIYWHIICKTKLSKYLPFTHICIYSLCQFSDTGIIMTSQRPCHARDSQNHAYIFYNARFVTARFGDSLADFCFAMYQNELIHVIIILKHDVACIGDRRHKVASRISQCEGRCTVYDYTEYMDYMSLDVCCAKKAPKLYHSLLR